jgi:hypothetical protein
MTTLDPAAGHLVLELVTELSLPDVLTGALLLLLLLPAAAAACCCCLPAMVPGWAGLTRFGPDVDPSRKFSSEEARAAVRLTTCAIKNIAPDLIAEEQLIEAQEAAAAAAEDIIAAAPNAGPAALQAAADAVQFLNMVRSQPKLLPLNVCVGSPDGAWLAVGADQTSVVLLPAAPG